MELKETNNYKEVFKVQSEYFKLDNEKKKEVLQAISIWIHQETIKL